MRQQRRDLVFRVFVSSTFDDLVVERNALEQEAFPALRTYCQERGARFQAIDLRWGVSREAALDQRTMNICRRELQRCQETSPRPNFLVLLGDRYGWRPLPPQIDAVEFAELCERLSDDERRRLVEWYDRDDNAVPPENVLASRTGEFVDGKRWSDKEHELRVLLLKGVDAVLEPSDPRRRRYTESAVHQEIRAGAFEGEGPQGHVFCYFREITALPEDGRAAKYRDICSGAIDEDARRRHGDLKSQLREFLPMNVRGYSARWLGDRPEWDVSKFCDDVRRDLQGVIDAELALFEQKPRLEHEQRVHAEFAQARTTHFRGRTSARDIIQAYLDGNRPRGPLVVCGLPGCGKTSLLAKAWADFVAREPTTQTVVRFIGVTPGSSDLRSLLSGVCRELGVGDVPTELSELIAVFCELLERSAADQGRAPHGRSVAEPPRLVVFLDALDQLTATDNAHLLYWLPRGLGAAVRLVVSVQGEQPSGVVGLAPLRSPEEDEQPDIIRGLPAAAFLEVGPLDEGSAADLLDTWLESADRTLQSTQRHEVMRRFANCPLPLFLELVFEEARRWRSWDDAPHVADSIEGVLDGLLGRLERPQEHGPVLAERALAYLAAGRHGLAEDELIDLLSTDAEVMTSVHERSPIEIAKASDERVRRLPTAIWARLYADLEPYLMRRRSDGTVVLGFHHRQVADAVCRRYLGAAARLRVHLHQAEYFAAQSYWVESDAMRKPRRGQRSPSPRLVNVRKVVELPHHRLEAAKAGSRDEVASQYWDAVEHLLTDWDFLEAKIEAAQS